MEENSLIQEWIEQYGCGRGTFLFLDRLREAGFSDPEIKRIFGVLDHVCHGCWDNSERCCCQWDD